MKSLSQVTIAVLAGGMGTRLASVVSDRPKMLATVQERPFLYHLFDQILLAGGYKVVLCTGHMAEQMADLGNSYLGLQISYSPETEPLGTGGAIRNAFPLLDSDPVMVMNGDSFVDADLNRAYQGYLQSGADVGMIAVQMDDTSRYGRVAITENGYVEGFEEKNEGSGPGWINAGVYFIRKHGLAEFPAGQPFSLENDFFPKCINRGFYAYSCRGTFIDIGTPESYSAASQFFEDFDKTECFAGGDKV